MPPAIPRWQRIVEAITTRQRFVLSSHARPDGDSIGSQLAMAYALRALGKDVSVVNSDAAPAAADGVSRRAGDRDRRPGGRRVRRRDHHGVQRPRANRGRGPRSVLRDQHRSPSGQLRLRPDQLVRRERRRLRRDGLRRDRRARGPAVARDRHARLPGDPHRHRIVPLLRHLAPDVRHLPRGAARRRRSGARGAQRLRQQQHGAAADARRGAERHAGG